MGRYITITNVKNGREFEYDYEIDREERDRIIEEIAHPEVLQALKTPEDYETLKDYGYDPEVYGYDPEDLKNAILEELLTEKRNEVEGLIHCWHNVQNWSQDTVRLS